jgi:hypothetical protein
VGGTAPPRSVRSSSFQLISKKPPRLVRLPRQLSVAILVEKFLTERKDETDSDHVCSLFLAPLTLLLGRKISETYSSASFHSLIGCVRLSSHGQIVTYCQALPLVLLYREERQQYDELSRCSVFLPSSTYGAEHLLRLFGLSSTPSAHLSTLSLPSTPLHPLTSLRYHSFVSETASAIRQH